MMYIVVIAWMFVVTLMSVVEATASNGSVKHRVDSLCEIIGSNGWYGTEKSYS